jgi:hypothetical protein
VAEVMRRDYLLVDGHINLEEFVESYLMRVGPLLHGHAQGLRGRLITLRDVRRCRARAGRTPRSTTRCSRSSA